jgi:hypothetical protein
MEEAAWLTQACWFRLATTLAGICVIDFWKLVKFHIPAAHPYSALSIGNFANILSKSTVSNGLQDHAVPTHRRGKSISVLLGLFQEQRVHVPGNYGRSEKCRSKHARCLHCCRDEGALQWTFFYCVQNGISLCMSDSKHNGDCFEHHMRLDPISLCDMKRVRTEKIRPTTAPL